ncbi:MAG: META domain-containing protein [Bernardetiaceae bacterium]
MKNYAFLLALLLLLACKTQQNIPATSDWEGTYEGVLPCPDCSGIWTRLTLRSDQSYQQEQRFLGKSDTIITTRGKVRWDKKTGTILQLEDRNRFALKDQQLLAYPSAQSPDTLAYTLRQYDNPLTERRWKLLTLNGKAVQVPPTDGQTPYVSFREGRIVGNAGCNMFNARYQEQDGQRIQFDQLMSTMMACPALETERALLDALETIDNYSLYGGVLSLNRARMAPLAVFEMTPNPDTP